VGSAAAKGQSSAALEERAQDGLQAQGRVDFALFNIPASLNPETDNEPKHGGVAGTDSPLLTMDIKHEEE
jgi:hypothetical protein